MIKTGNALFDMCNTKLHVCLDILEPPTHAESAPVILDELSDTSALLLKLYSGNLVVLHLDAVIHTYNEYARVCFANKVTEQDGVHWAALKKAINLIDKYGEGIITK